MEIRSVALSLHCSGLPDIEQNGVKPSVPDPEFEFLTMGEPSPVVWLTTEVDPTPWWLPNLLDSPNAFECNQLHDDGLLPPGRH